MATARKTPTRTRRGAPRSSTVAAPNVIEISTSTEAERLPLFSLDGVEYSMLAVVPAAWVLDLMEDPEFGENPNALMDVVKDVMGADAWDALHTEGVGMADAAKVLAVVQQHILGQVEDLGKASRR